MKIDLLYKE